MINRYRREILYLLEQKQVLIIVGPTGSGKSTQLPELLLKAGIYNHDNKDQSNQTLHYDHKLIGVTQPRRVAAAQLAQRVASNLNYPLGTIVGYAVRFEDKTSRQQTRVKYLTEGLLIREMMVDPNLSNYSVIIVDEAHVRNLNTDILLGLMKCIIFNRSDLKLIICSATLDVEQFRNFFTFPEWKIDQSKRKSLSGSPEIFSIFHRSHPLKIYHVEKPTPNYLDASVETVINIHEASRLSRGKILVFLTGQDEVDYVCQRLDDYSITISNRTDLKQLLVLPLHAALRPEQISTVFDEHGKKTRVCVVATNVAETSLTINDIAHVVDCGFVKVKSFDLATGTDSLVRIPISKSSAKQRAGRAGRTREGQVYRLYPEVEYEKLAENSVPEIQRSSLSETIMLLMSLGVENVMRFPLISPMPRDTVSNALESLYALKAIDESGCLTSSGQIMAGLNLDPKLCKMLISIQSSGCTREVCRVAAILQVKDIYKKPKGHFSFWNNESLAKLCVIEGDLLSYLNMLDGFVANKMNNKWAERRCLDANVLSQALDIASKLETQLKRRGIAITSSSGRTELIQKAILSGLFMNAAYLHPSGVYKTIRGEQTVFIHPTSIYHELVEDKPSLVIFSEILNTTKPFMRHIMAIEKDWLLNIAPHYYRIGFENK